MGDWLRRAGRGRDAEGWSVIWSVAEGRRGRRWREVRHRGLDVASSLLLETGPAGRFAHLELSTAFGLLTLHPEGDGTLHGNAVTPGGVEHVRGRAWDADGLVVIEGSTICQAAAAALLGHASPAVSSASRPGVVVSQALSLDLASIRVERVGPTEWRFGDREPIRLDRHGLPFIDEGESWPLEE